MKRTLALTAATAALALSLAACGADGGMRDANGTAGGSAAGTMQDSGGKTGADSGNGQNAASNGLGSVSGAVNSGREPIRRGMTQDQAAARSRLERMLENARVHDTDGFLLDGENASNSTL